MAGFRARDFRGGASRRLVAGSASLVFVGGALLAVGTAGHAQIPQGNGAAQQDNRTSAMGSQPASSTQALHESHKPQAKDSAQRNPRGKNGAQNSNPQGAGGFNNGLYGTGAGSNK
ncbi:beta-xylosidase [Paraburkholderia sp. G-4-1-8]|uniref:Beta-xylosidase n=1 Tax=Paraburkholderia antibiotica TaxID=2728839 RepID=A0A7Y0FFX7_9BURK|nr:beta-xylosidase [Paraburkholderia antibiotica]